MKTIVVMISSLLIGFASHAQTKQQRPIAPVMSKEDSVLLLQKEAGLYIDSLVRVTSMKQFRDFLESQISVKTFNDGRFVELYDLFIRTNLDQWLQRRTAKKPPSN